MDLKHTLDNVNENLEAKNKQINNLKKAHSTKIAQL